MEQKGIPIVSLQQTKNFGDAVNSVFWNKISGIPNHDSLFKPHYLTTGSIMFLANRYSIVFGTGFISQNADVGGYKATSKQNKIHEHPRSVLAVRGPLTRHKCLRMGIRCPPNYGDPLILFPCVYPKYTKAESSNIVGIIPHYIDKNHPNVTTLAKQLQNAGHTVRIIDIEVGANYKKLIDEINQCSHIISSSLHGIIMGIIYKRNTIYIPFSDKVIGNQFKFQDFFLSIGIKYTPPIGILDETILDRCIPIDYTTLQGVGAKLISLIPFVSKKRKTILTNNYTYFYTTICQ